MGSVYETEVICLTKCSKYVIMINRHGWEAISNEEFCKDNPTVDEAMLLDVTDIGAVSSTFTAGMERSYENSSGFHGGAYSIEEFRDFIVKHSKIGYFQLKNLCKKITTEMQIELESYIEDPEDWESPGTESSYGEVNINPVLARVILDTY